MSDNKYTPEYLAVQKILTHLNRKEEVPDELWDEAKVKKGLRVKDLQKKATEYKSGSLAQKLKDDEKKEKEEEIDRVNKGRQEEAERRGITLGELIEEERRKKKGGPHLSRVQHPPGHTERQSQYEEEKAAQELQREQRIKQREKEATVRESEMRMKKWRHKRDFVN